MSLVMLAACELWAAVRSRYVLSQREHHLSLSSISARGS